MVGGTGAPSTRSAPRALKSGRPAIRKARPDDRAFRPSRRYPRPVPLDGGEWVDAGSL
jgi:hypothetical protein